MMDEPPEDFTDLQAPFPRPARPQGSLETLRDGDSVYEVLQTHRGGMGIVHICRLRDRDDAADDDGPLVALKTFEERVFFEPTTAAALEAETALWIRLSNEPFVMPILGRPTIEGKPHILMPAVLRDGAPSSLADLLDRPQSAAGAMRILLPLAIALDRCGRKVEGFVHGDIKPANVLLSPGGPLLTDFGLAKAAGRRGVAGGTEGYVAPECRGGLATPAGDIFALGVLARDLLGEPPHPERDPYAADVRPILELCRSPDPAARPSAGELAAQLAAMAMPHDPYMVFGLLGRLREEPREARIALIATQARTLLDAGEPDFALQLIADLPAQEHDAEIQRLHGNALSLLGRDEEALPLLEAALLGADTPGLRLQIRNDIGLSLRRLSRLEEARGMFESLITEAPEDLREMVAGNYARVLIDLGEHREAATRLRRLVRRNPENAILWSLLGLAQKGLAAPEDALESLRRALQLAPRDGQLHQLQGEILMDQLGRVEEALISLDLAIAVGGASLSLAEALLCGDLLIGRMDDLAALMEALEGWVGDEGARQALERARRRAADVAARFGGDAPAIGAEKPEVPTLALTIATAPDPPEPEAPPPAEPAEQQTGIGDGPFVNVRYLADGAFLIDFYLRPVDAPDYPERMARAFARIVHMTEGLDDVRQLRGRPFLLAKCPGCGWEILTLRDPGESLRCRGCDERHPVSPLETEAAAALVLRCEQWLGRSVAPAGPGEVFVGAFARDGDDLDGLDQALLREGFERVEAGRVIEARLGMNAFEAGLSRTVGPSAVWRRAVDPEELVVMREAPRTAERAIYAARLSVHSPPPTMSLLAPQHAVAWLLSPLETMVDDLGSLSDEDIGRDPHQGCSAVVNLAHAGRLPVAQSLFERILRRFPDHPAVPLARGSLALVGGNPAAAVPDLQAAAQAYPRDHMVGFAYAAALAGAGDRAAADREFARLRAVGFVAPEIAR